MTKGEQERAAAFLIFKAGLSFTETNRGTGIGAHIRL